MRRAFKLFKVRNQDLAAPRLAVRSITRAIECHTDDRPRELIFSHAAGDVSVMMLHADQANARLTFCPLGCNIPGVQIVCDDGRPHFKGVLEVSDRFLKELVCGQAFKVTYVLTDKCGGATGDADRVLKLATDSEDG
jgi:hypothetical protein